jgi:predicted RNase H-like HicB family nuclease
MTRSTSICFYATVEKVGLDWLVKFPDFPNINTCGVSFWHALACAEEALNSCLEADLDRQFSLPTPSDFRGRLGYFPIQVRRKIVEAYVRKGAVQRDGGGPTAT